MKLMENEYGSRGGKKHQIGSRDYLGIENCE